MPPTSTTKPDCEHIYLRQTILSPTLPPLYIANPAPPPSNPHYIQLTNFATPISEHMSSVLITQLERVHARLGPKRVRSPFLARDIQLLQHELEDGMTRDRREQMEIYVAGIQGPWKKACTELYLARYPGFVMRGDGKLDYGTRGRETEVGGGYLKDKEDWGVFGNCGVM